MYCKTRLYCNRRGPEAGSSVLQYTALYCNLGARQGWTVLRYSAQPSHDTATVAATRHAGAGRWACWALGMLGARRAGAGLSGRARGAGGWARRARVGSGSHSMGARSASGRSSGRRRCRRLGVAGARAVEQALGVRCRRGAGVERAAGRRWARGGLAASALVVWAGYGLCTRCTRLVFGPVRLSIFPEPIFGHCS